MKIPEIVDNLVVSHHTHVSSGKLVTLLFIIQK